MHRWFEKLANYGTEWETKNHLMTAALEQAAHDRHLLYGAERSKNFELTYPEYVIGFLLVWSRKCERAGVAWVRACTLEPG